MKYVEKAKLALKAVFAKVAQTSRERPNLFIALLSLSAMSAIVCGWALYFMLQPPDMSMTKLMAEAEAKHVERAEVLTDNFGYMIYATIDGTTYAVKAPMVAVEKGKDGKDGTNILQALKDSGADIKFLTSKVQVIAIVMALFSPIIMLTLMALMVVAMFKDGSTAWMTLKRNVSTKFSDMAGAEEAKHELREVIDFMTGKIKIEGSKARTPRGVLLSGPPGTGKTLLAKAIAGEAGTSFIAVSGSDFQSSFYGGSQRRVKSLFAYARKNTPCVIFIDEFDAIGSKRSEGGDVISKESNGTLNQLLVQMDGFDDNSGILVVGATNMVDQLDPAVKRPGRLDRRVEVGLPDQNGRKAILEVHTADHLLAGDVDLTVVARGVPGFSGAEIENLVNEATVFAARQGRNEVTADDFEKAKNKLIMGLERRSLVLSEAERRLTAYHEAGHALVATVCEHSDAVHRATIIPHGRALGMVVRLPENDRVSLTLAKLLDDLAVTMAGRAAEAIVFGKDFVTTGAQSDIEHATMYATAMVTDWGLSDKVGMVKVSKERAANDPLVESEIRSIIGEAYSRAVALVTEHRKALEAVALALLDKESLDGDEVRALIAAGRDTSEAPRANAA
jgi:cell division protease FtsH